MQYSYLTYRCKIVGNSFAIIYGLIQIWWNYLSPEIDYERLLKEQISMLTLNLISYFIIIPGLLQGIPWLLIIHSSKTKMYATFLYFRKWQKVSKITLHMLIFQNSITLAWRWKRKVTLQILLYAFLFSYSPKYLSCNQNV